MEGKVKVIGNTVIATEDTLSKVCPARPKWAAGIISNLGLEIALQSPKLRRVALCPEVLQLAGYTLKVVSPEDFEKTVESVEKKEA
jgi:hypothetical protein